MIISTYIVIVNYNGWADTIECLESVLRGSYYYYRILVVDNNSLDNSMDHLKAWAEGRLEVLMSPDNPLQRLSRPPIQKPIPYVQYDRTCAEAGGATDEPDTRLVLIQSGDNLGFAGGNNVALRYALARNDVRYIWMLNNDAVIDKDALTALIEKANTSEEKGSHFGISGSKLLYYDRPRIIQGVGGKYIKCFAMGKHLGAYKEDKGQYDVEDIDIDYVIGASMFVNLDFLKDVGLLCEDYFLYFEEMDWALRAKQKGWKIGYACKSKVYHKESASIGSSSLRKQSSEIGDFYRLKNKIIFTKKYFRRYLFSVYLGLIFIVLNRIRRRQFKRARMIIELLAKSS